MNGSVKIFGRPAANRHQSQDFALALDQAGRIAVSNGYSKKAYSDRRALFLVADGLGAHAEPRRAAAHALQVFSRHFRDYELFLPERACRLAHQSLQARSKLKQDERCAGAALAGVALIEGRCWAFSCGDVNIYVAERERDFQEVPLFPPQRNSRSRLSSCLGGSFSGSIDVNMLEIKNWWMVAVCSDGYWEPRASEIPHHLSCALASDNSLPPHEDDQSLLILQSERS